MHASDLGRRLADFLARVDALHQLLARAVRQQPDESEFEDAVVLGIQTGGFEVEKNDGTFELEEHAA